MANITLARTGRIILAVVSTGLMACSPIVRSHGYIPAEDQIAEIQVGKDTRDTVAEKIGMPTTLGVENDGAWYYVASVHETFGPRKPKTISRDIVAVRFADSGQVENIERFDVTDGRVVVLTARVTDPAISERGFLSQVFGNVAGPTAGDLIGEDG